MKKVAYLLVFISTIGFSQVGIGTTTPDASSLLDITSSSAGILIPRMTETDRTNIASPATGLLVYQTNNTAGFWFYNGSSWINIPTTAGSGEFQSIGGVVQNTTNVGGDDFVFGATTLSGSDSKFWFDKSKAAFRAGEASGTEWDDLNVGTGSIALGSQTTASGEYSVSLGLFSNAAGDYSFSAGGFANGYGSVAFAGGQAEGLGSMALGSGAIAQGENAFALGESANTNADYAVAFGFSASATSQYAVAMGGSSISSGSNAFSASGGNASGTGAVAFSTGQAAGDYSFAFAGEASGNGAIAFIGSDAIGDNSMSFGASSQALGESSIAMGADVTAYSYGETVFGFDAESYTPSSTTTPIASDRLFVIGNGGTPSVPSINNAFTMLKDGKTGFSRIPTTNILEVEGDASKTTPGSWLANSDGRLKTNIETISEEKALDKILKLRGVTYQWNDHTTGYKRPEGTQYGFIAQELMQVFPEKVSMDNMGYYQTAYGDYDAVFVQAFKALNSKIEALQKDNTQLKEENEMLKMKLDKITELELRLEALESVQN
tara:strand:+ start:264564 stop:266210 length:1647 start_codon:yes stop_codon:yes gene_type:complete